MSCHVKKNNIKFQFQNVSYSTLCSILEYIYTGEVHIAKESLNDLMAAGKALHIKGLKEMVIIKLLCYYICVLIFIVAASTTHVGSMILEK